MYEQSKIITITEKALSPGKVINLKSNLSHLQYEKRLSIHHTERYLPHMPIYLRNGYIYLVVRLYTYLYFYT